MQAIAILLLMASAITQQTGLTSPAVQSAAKTIRPEAIRAHMRYLADDLLEGRGTATRGQELAAKYIAAQFEAMGLEPAGADGTYFQPVPLVRSDLDRDASSISIVNGGKETKLTDGRDYVMGADLLREKTSLDAPAIFVGYGITDPDLGWDDYKGIDAKGKVVVIIAGGPAMFESSVRAVLSDLREKQRNAVAHGAVAMIRISTDGNGRLPSGHEAMTWVEADGTPQHAQMRLSATLNENGAAALFVGSGKSMQDAAAAARLNPSPLDLRANVRMSRTCRITTATSPNVVAIVRGSDPALRSEYVAYSAHSDHLGIGPAVSGDTIYNGALDNASGTSALIEIARTFASLEKKPSRSLLFVAVTGEERGQLGSEYFASHPTVHGQLVADINIDGLPVNAVADVVGIGAEHSTLIENIRRAAAVMNYQASPDPEPDRPLFVQSDQYSFAKQGVPSVYLTDGEKSMDPKLDIKAFWAQWRARRYHQPSDDMSQPIDWSAMSKFVQFAFLVGYDVADETARPRWNASDIFEARFRAKQ